MYRTVKLGCNVMCIKRSTAREHILVFRISSYNKFRRSFKKCDFLPMVWCIQQDACTILVLPTASLSLRMRWFSTNLRKQTTTRATEVLKKSVRVRGPSSDANKLEERNGLWLKTRLIMAARWHACVRLSEMAVCKISG